MHLIYFSILYYVWLYVINAKFCKGLKYLDYICLNIQMLEKWKSCVSPYICWGIIRIDLKQIFYSQKLTVCACVFSHLNYFRNHALPDQCVEWTLWRQLVCLFFFSPLGFEQVVVCIGKLPTPESSFQRSGPGRHNELGVDDTLN